MNKIYQFILGMVMAVLAVACTADKELEDNLLQVQGGTVITVDASMPSDNATSKVGISQQHNSLNMIAKWDYGDHIQVFVSQDGRTFDVGYSEIKDISDGRKTCKFSFILPPEINVKKEYLVVGFYGFSGTLDNGIITIEARMERVPIEDFAVPVYFIGRVSEMSVNASFKLLGAYEILHVTNKSGNNIIFSMSGYSSDHPWYYDALRYTIDCRNIPDLNPTIAFSGNLVGNSKTRAAAIGKNGGTATFVSWYEPNGNTISNATLWASISSCWSVCRSTNKKSSNTVIQRGKAYHLYAVWDGEELKFCNQDGSISDVVTNSLTITGTSVSSATVGTTANVTATANKQCNITMFVNGTAKATATNKTSLTYDLSKLSPGTYKIKFKAQDGTETAETEEFECKVTDSFVPLAISCNPVGVATIGEVTNVTATTNKSCDIYMIVDGSTYTYTEGQTSLTYDFSQLPEGTHLIQFKAVLGSEMAETREFQCTVSKPTFHVQLRAYATTSSGFGMVSEVEYGTLVEFQVKTDQRCLMDLYIDGKKTYTSPSMYDANQWIRMYATDELSSGTHSIKIAAAEQYGNAFDEITLVVKSTQCYDYVDLGLPSGILWATCNVGAGHPWEYGEYLNTEEDPATIKMGSAWRLPTQDEFREIIRNCELVWTDNYNGTGVKGLVVSSTKNSNSIFLPVEDGLVGYYWSSTKYEFRSGYYYFLQFSYDGFSTVNNAQLREGRKGLLGRAVRNK